jgi:hypothetical protein
MKSTVMHKVSANRGWIIPLRMANKGDVRKRARLSSPISPHTINTVETVSVEDMVEEVELDDDNIEGIA